MWNRMYSRTPTPKYTAVAHVALKSLTGTLFVCTRVVKALQLAAIYTLLR